MIFNLRLTVHNALVHYLSLWFILGSSMDIFETLRKHVRSLSFLARELGVSPQALDGWRRRNQIPADRVLEIERITKYRVTRYMMRPDIFGADPVSFVPSGCWTAEYSLGQIKTEKVA